jgi:hypothetical protein
MVQLGRQENQRKDIPSMQGLRNELSPIYLRPLRAILPLLAMMTVWRKLVVRADLPNAKLAIAAV